MRVRGESGRIFEIVEKAQTPMPQSYISVLWGISQFASSDVFDPSYSQIAKITGVTIRTVQRAVISLEVRGHVEVIERYSQSGYQISHRYKLTEPGIRVVANASKLGALKEIDAAGMHIQQPIVLRKGVTECLAPNAVDVVGKQLQLTTRLTADQQVMAADMLSRIPADDAQVLADELRERIAGGGVKSPLGYLAQMIVAFDRGTFKPILAGKGAKLRLGIQDE